MTVGITSKRPVRTEVRESPRSPPVQRALGEDIKKDKRASDGGSVASFVACRPWLEQTAEFVR